MAARPRRRLLWGSIAAAAVFAVVVAGSVLYAASLPAQYTGVGVMQFSPRPMRNGPVVGNETVAAAASGSVAYLGAPSTIQSVASSSGVTTTDLKDGLAVTLLPATTTVTVDFTSADAQRAASVTNAMMASAVNRAKSDPLVVASVLAKAAVPQNPSGPPRTVIAAAGGLLALILAAITLALFVVVPRRWSLLRWLAPGEPDETEPTPTPPPRFDSGPSDSPPSPNGPPRVVTVEPVLRGRGHG